jgi:hypothetical protein
MKNQDISTVKELKNCKRIKKAHNIEKSFTLK